LSKPEKNTDNCGEIRIFEIAIAISKIKNEIPNSKWVGFYKN
jgi:hypothetical protein